MLKKLIENHIYILIYLLVLIMTVIRIFSLENNIVLDRSNLANDIPKEIECIVISIPKLNDDTLSFNCKVTKGTNIKSYAHVQIDYAKDLEIFAGDNLKLTGCFKTPADRLNPGGFSYAEYLKSQGVSVIFKSNSYQISKHSHSVLTPLYRLRAKVSAKIFSAFPKDEASVINALVTGSKDEMDEVMKENFRKAGVYHIIAVSGLHLNLLIMFLSFIYVGMYFDGKMRKFLALTITGVCSVFVLLFTGIGVSVQRAAVMAGILCVAALVKREYSPTASLFTALIIILYVTPFSYLDPSFQLSFSATAGIIFALAVTDKYDFSKFKFGNLLKATIITLSANIFTLPFVISSFGYVSSVSVLTNLVIAPIVPFLLAMSYLFSAFSLFMPKVIVDLFANITVVPAYGLNFLATTFAKIPFSYIAIPPSILCTLAIFIVVFVFVLKSKKSKTILACFFIIANIAFIAYNTYNKQCELTFLNVGQGECALIQDSHGTAIMIDCGSDSNKNIAENEIIPYLRHQNIYKLDALFVTHWHDDHTNAIEELIVQGYVKKLFLPKRLPTNDETNVANNIYRLATQNNIQIYHVSKNDSITINSVHNFDVLNPDSRFELSANDSSLVLKYSYGKNKVLFTGDIEDTGMYLVSQDAIECDILKVSHHGALNNFSDKLAKAANAKYAVISCSKSNSFNHPHPDTLNAFKNYKIHITHKDGPANFKLTSSSVIEEK